MSEIASVAERDEFTGYKPAIVHIDAVKQNVGRAHDQKNLHCWCYPTTKLVNGVREIRHRQGESILGRGKG